MADQVAPLAPVENKELSVSLSPQVVCEENQDSTGAPMTDGNPESQEMLQIRDSVETDEDALSTLESPPQTPSTFQTSTKCFVLLRTRDFSGLASRNLLSMTSAFLHLY